MVNSVWDFCYLYFSHGCSARWEELAGDTSLPIPIPGKLIPGEVAVLGVEAPGEGFPHEASHQVEAEAFRVRACEAVAEAAVPAGPINIQGDKDVTIYQTCDFHVCSFRYYRHINQL